MAVSGEKRVYANPQHLAINGGTPVRSAPLPTRRLFGEDELRKVTEVFTTSWETGVDFGFQGVFEQEYTEAFCAFQGAGFADAVSTGTIAVYLALATLDLPRGSDVVVSPVTDPGSVSPVIFLGHTPVVADSQPNNFNIGAEQFDAALTPNTRCAIITHLGGIPVDLAPILDIAKAKGIAVIEDCSQAHGAMYQGKRVGTFGDLAAFSTMFSKNHATGGCGGLVYTKDESLYWRCRALADRGKSFDHQDFDPRDPDTFFFPSLNFNLDELSCAIGVSTLAKLQSTIDRRLEIIKTIDAGLSGSKVVTPITGPEDIIPSPFFHTLVVDTDRISVTKNEFAAAVRSEGVGINPGYRSVVSQWGWLRQYLKNPTDTPNAVNFRDTSFNILFHEKFTDADARDIIDSILKVEAAYARD